MPHGLTSSLSDMDIAGADLSHKIGRKMYATKDPRFASAPSFSFGRRHESELNTMACNRPQFCKTGTHRAVQGERLLDPLRRRNDKIQTKMKTKGLQYLAPPGPGTYRAPRVI